MAITLGLLSAFVAELTLPAVVAAWGPQVGSNVPTIAGHGSSHGTTDHHHPGCPWRGKGPCPHQRAPDSARGPVITACAEIPAAQSDGSARLLLDRRPVVDWSLRPLEVWEPARTDSFVDPHTQGFSPEPPPPRSLPAL
ncbi:MAG: hypothetical protein ACREMD_13235 [Gemmatimonadota bacterium]